MKHLPLLLLCLALASCESLQMPQEAPQPTAYMKAPPIPVSPKTIVVKTPIIIQDGSVFDGRLVKYVADRNALGDGSQAEGQRPLFIIKGSGVLRNVVIGAPAADGIHVQPADGKTCRIENVHWLDVGEDAISILTGNGSSKVQIHKCTFRKAVDKILQSNSAAKVYVSDCYADSFGRFARGCGTCTPPKPYWFEIRNLRAQNGDAILKLTNKEANGYIIGGKFEDVKHIAIAENGAKISVKP